ncbi:MAG: 1-acyl-sn-glycerol-3-phosphate acyltransferase [Clostridiales bacterium]|jgi:1-acyl-sn-glycerol-3-phosphate acyltransferase|nr:1-acyl-sn-glycerol-3-phosphate acyltransferase [Clostridiales bacterium]
MKQTENKSRGGGFFFKKLKKLACFIIKTAFRNEIVKKTPIDYCQNYLILCAHGSGLDMFHTMAALEPLDYTVVAARKLFFGKLLGGLLRASGAIPKKQFVTDLTALRLVKNAAESGKSIFICPEGRSTPDGTNSHVSPAIAKMVKWLGLPVLFVKPQGSYLSFPRWVQSPRFGKMTTEVELLLTKREVANLSNQEIYEKIKKAFTFNEYDYQIENGIKFLTPSPAKKIHNLLFICPECKSQTDMYSTSKEICCRACGLKAKVDVSGKLEFQKSGYFDRIDQWVAFQKNEIARLVAKDGFYYQIKTALSFEDELNNSYKKVADGVFAIDKNGAVFTAESFFEDIDKSKYSKITYPSSAFASLSYGSSYLELYAHESTQKYSFGDGVITYKISLLLEAVYALGLTHETA